MKGHDTTIVHGSDFPDWMTPAPLYGALDMEVRGWGILEPSEPGIATDLAASAESTLAPLYLGAGSNLGENALVVDWSALAQPCFLNPPYSRELKMPIEPWIEKLRDSARVRGVYFSLIPFRPDTRWWRLTDEAAEIREIPHRVKFELPPDAFARMNEKRLAIGKDALTATSGAGFPSAVVVWRSAPGALGVVPPRRYTWDYLDRRPRARKGRR